MIHLRPLPNAHDKALKPIKDRMTHELRLEVAMRPVPKHAAEHEHFRRFGEPLG